MNDTLQSILGDLYSLDPDLKNSEKDLIPLLEKLVESKPDLKLDQQFVANLRNQIVSRANELMEAEKPIGMGWFHRFLAPLMGGTVALAALVIGLMVWNGQTGLIQTTEPKSEETSLAMKIALPPASPEPVAMPEGDRFAKPGKVPQEALEKRAQDAPAVETVPEATPMLFQALPAEDTTGIASPAPEMAPASALRQMAPVPEADQIAIRDALLQNAYTRAQTGELKIETVATGKKNLLPGDITNVDLNNLPQGYVEIINVLPAGIRVIEDQTPTWVDGLPQYYLYFEKENQWYGPF